MGIVLTLNLLTMALSGLGLRERLNWLPCALLTVESGSMEPVLSEGDLLLVWETPYEKLEIGDLVTFHGNNELVTHQIARAEGSCFVTRGIANNVEDTSIGPEEYCAKVILTVPQGGAVLEILTSPTNLLLLSLLVLAVVYALPILRWISAMLAGQKAKTVRPGTLRLMASGMVISLFCITPFMTAAKYTADINEYASVSAGVTYFTSNYLSAEGNVYYIQGWNGVGYGISLDIRNYENDLLFNQTGNDLRYEIEFKVIESDVGGDGQTVNYNTEYAIELLDGSTVLEPQANGKYGAYQINGDSGGEKSKRFEVEVATENEKVLPGGTKIRFQIIASTTSNEDFEQRLMGDFTFEATDAKSFLGERKLDSQVGSALVTYSLQTELVEGATTRDVKITWNPSKVYLNEFEETAANIIASDHDKTRYSAKDGFLIMSLHAYSKVDLQFFKYDSATNVVMDDFTCTDLSLKT